jgi:ELWxxDGT repeat protein
VLLCTESIIITSFNNQAYFTGSDPMLGPSLWKSDGSEAGTSMVIDNTRCKRRAKFMLGIGNILYITCANGSTGDELWKVMVLPQEQHS